MPLREPIMAALDEEEAVGADDPSGSADVDAPILDMTM